VTVTLSLNPEIEKGLIARARERGVSLDDYLQELLSREAGVTASDTRQSVHARFKNLSDLLLNSPFAEAADLDLERIKDYPRPVDLG
jgi:hypothetical protein